MESRLKKWACNAGLIVLSVATLLLILELALRFTPYRYLLSRDRHLRHYYQADLRKGFDITPNVKGMRLSVDNRIEFDIWSNELGCFDRPYGGETDYILLMGDSFTHSYAPLPDKWGTRMENLLNYRVLKCGVSGYGTRQELLKAAEIIARVQGQPRLIVVGYFWNDLSDDYSFPNLTVIDGFLVDASRYRAAQGGGLDKSKLEKKFSFWDKWFSRDYPLNFREKIGYYLERRLIVMNLVNDAVVRVFPPKNIPYADPSRFLAFQEEQPWSREVWKQHLQNLAAFQDLAAAHRAQLLVVLIPTNTQVYPFLASRQVPDLERPNQILSRFLKEQGIPYLDLLPPLRGCADATPRRILNPDKDLYWANNSHWSIRGEHLVGLLVSRHILTNRLLQVPDREARLKDIEETLRRWR